MLIALGIPNGNNGNNEMMGTLSYLAYELGKLSHGMAYLGGDSCCIDKNRNEIIFQAQQIGADYLLMLDTDIELITEGDILTSMIALGKDIVAGVYYQGTYPYRPVVYNFGESGINNFADIPNEPFKVEACGGGLLLISKKVIDHFKHGTPGNDPFDYMYSPMMLREDAAFCYRCKEAGFEIWADPRVKLNHWKRQSVNESWWLAAKNKIVSGAIDKAKDGGIDGWMSDIELEWLQGTAAMNETVVEIGSWKGRSTKALLDTGAYVTAIDHWKGSDTIKGLADSQDVYSEFMENVGMYGNLSVWKMPSLQAAAYQSETHFDMVFIDAGHSYEDCKNDIEAWLPRADKIICGHDYQPGWPGVMRAVKEKFGDRFKTVGSIWYVNLREA